MKNSQGSNANKLGRSLENAVEFQLKDCGFLKIDGTLKRQFVTGILSFGDEPLGDRWYIRNAKKYLNLYGTRFFADFIVFDAVHFPTGLLIEVKNQETPGSVDEKYVFSVLTLKSLPFPTWLIFSGEGARLGAIEWMRNQQTKEFTFLNESQFRRKLVETVTPRKPLQ